MTDDGSLFRRALQRRTTQPESEARSSERRDGSRSHVAPPTVPRIDVSTVFPADEATSYRQLRPNLPPDVLPIKRRHALVVEDDEVLRQGAAAVLVDEGWGVVEAATLEAARAVLGFLRPDVMILDFNLQGEYASVLLDEIVHKGRGVPTVLASASPLAIDAARAYRLELLMKPFEIDRLIAVVERIARERTSAPVRRAG